MEIPDGALSVLIEAVHEVKRELAVLTERLGNEKDNRDLFAVAYERRHQELQDHIAGLRQRQETADSEREMMKATLGGMAMSITTLQRDVDGISSSIRWVVYLILGFVITAILGIVIGGALGHVKVN